MKEKLGELRVHVRGGGEAARAAIRAAEEEAGRTCEVCGASGRLRRDRSHLQVLCAPHAYVPPSAVIRALARRFEHPSVRPSLEAAAVLDDWELELEGGYVVLSGVERGTGAEVMEKVVVAVEAGPVARAYTARGWVELGHPSAYVDAPGLLARMRGAADAVRDRVLGRRP